MFCCTENWVIPNSPKIQLLQISTKYEQFVTLPQKPGPFVCFDKKELTQEFHDFAKKLKIFEFPKTIIPKASGSQAKTK